MTGTSAKILDKLEEAVQAKPTKAKVESQVTHYIGCYSDTKNADDIIQHLQSDQCFPTLKYVNHRAVQDGKRTQVWLSTKPTEFTVNN